MSNRINFLYLRRFVIASAVSFIAWLGLPFAEAKADEPWLTEEARAVMSQTTGKSVDELTVVAQSLLPSTGIRRFKVMDTQGNVHGVNLDDFGNPVSWEEVQQAVKANSNRGFVGKLKAELAARLSAQHDTDPVNVILWLKAEKAPAQPLRQQRLSEEERRSHLANVMDQIAAIQQPVVDTLRAMGQQVIYQAQYAPAIVAAASPSAIWTMESWDEIERIYLEGVNKPRLNVSRVVVQAHVVNNSGIDGSGIRVGVVEPGRIAQHPNLPGAQRVLCRPEAASFVSAHKTPIAGVIQSTHKPFMGVAPQITLVDGITRDDSDAEVMAATDCVINEGATAINYSFGEDTKGRFNALARFVDATAYRTRVTFVVAVANSCDERIGGPDIAFNAIAVGQFRDQDTTGFDDDRMACSAPGRSAFLDPISPHNDREEPDVVAPGATITTTDVGNSFVTTGGTSVAAPFVTGGVGLLEERFGGGLPTELARAILMASARHNLEGDSRLSERDGAGGILLAAADAVLGDNDTNFLIDMPGGLEGFPDRRIFKAFTGQKVRVVLAWLHKSPLGDAMDEPTTDLDLIVFGHFPFFDGTIRIPLGFSLSYDNNYEIVEFSAPIEGTYSAEIVNFRPSAGQEFLGLGVSRISGPIPVPP